MVEEGTFCWEDSETGCVCGNECEPPRMWITPLDAEGNAVGKMVKVTGVTHVKLVLPGEGIHDWSDKVCLDSHVDFEICQEPNGVHECWEKFPHSHEDHSCVCGFEWGNDV